MFQNIVFVMQRQKIWEGGRKRKRKMKMAKTVVTVNLTLVPRNWLALDIHDILDPHVIEVLIELNHNAILGSEISIIGLKF